MHELRAHASVYDGDLFDGCYQDWCLLERERLQNVYLVLLDKEMFDYICTGCGSVVGKKEQPWRSPPQWSRI